MPVIKILPHAELCPEGRTIEAPRGTSLCEALLENGIAIEHACEMSCACTTCHVVVKEGLQSLGEMDESEEDLLVTSRSFDLRALVEDELLLSLPMVPMHESCPVAVKLEVRDADFVDEDAPESNPFAKLAALKKS